MSRDHPYIINFLQSRPTLLGATQAPNTTMEPGPATAPRQKGNELPVRRRHTLATDIGMAINPSFSTLPDGEPYDSVQSVAAARNSLFQVIFGPFAFF